MKNRSLHAVLTRFGIIAAVLATLVFIAPAASAAVQKYTVEENTTDPIARFTASDEEGTEITWSVDGDDKGDFEISEAGVLTFKEKPNFESPADEGKNNVYNVTVVAASKSKATQDVEVTVTDVAEAGKVTFSGLGMYQPQVGRGLVAAVSDPDGDGPTDVKWQWSRGPNVDGPWTDIAKATSADRSPVADDVDNYLQATATYTDKFGSGQTASAVSENPVEAKTLSNAAPDLSAHDTVSGTEGVQATREVDENAKGANVGKPLVAKDGDNDVLHYTIADGSTATVGTNNDIDELTLFSIDERTGQIKTKKEIDSDADSTDTDDSEDTYTVIVTATDPSGATDTATVTITINNINDAPKFADPTSTANQKKLTVEENGTTLDGDPDTADTQEPSYSATDDDTADSTLTYAVTGADASKFYIANSGGTLAFCSDGNAGTRSDDGCTKAHTPNYEGQSSYSISVTASDDEKAVGKVDVTVSVTNANDAGTVKLSMREPQVDRPVTASLSDPDGTITDLAWQWYWDNDATADNTDFSTAPANCASGSDNLCTIDGANSPTYTPKGVNPAGDKTLTATRWFLTARATYDDKAGDDDSAFEPTERAVQASDPANAAPKFDDDNDPNTPGDQPDVERSVAENDKGATVGDPVVANDSVDLLMYTIGGADASSFEIDRDKGQIKTAEELNYEVKDSYTIVVTATDPSGATDTTNVNITVTDADDKGVITGDKSYTIDENTVALGSYLATDEDGDAIEWGVSGDDKGKFSISDTGVLTFKDKPSYEAKASADDDNVYKVNVTANKGSLAVEVTVEDVDEDGKVTLDQPQPQVSRTITATGPSDPDAPVTDEKWQWSSGPSMNGPWTDIAKATSNSRTPAASDVGMYLRATVTYNDKFGDGQTASAVSENAVEARTLANAAPAFTDEDSNTTGIQVSREVNENAKGANAGKPVTAKDADGDVLLYVLSTTAAPTHTASDDFKIDSRSGQIATKVALDANPGAQDSADRNVTVYVTATDPSGASEQQPVVITIKDINDTPEFRKDDPDTTDADETVKKSLWVTEDVGTTGYTPALRTGAAADAAGLAATEYVVTDDDSSDTDGQGDPAFRFAYSLEGADKGKFSINATTGVLTVESDHKPDYEKQSKYSITIKGADDEKAAASVDVTVNVVNAEDAAKVTLNRREPQVGQAVVASLSDPDGGTKGIEWQWYWDSDGTVDTDLTAASDCSDVSNDPCKIVGATSPSYTPKGVNPADETTVTAIRWSLVARATYTDGFVTDANADDIDDGDNAFKVAEAAVQAADPANTAPAFPGDTDPNTDGSQDTYEFSVDENAKDAVAKNTLHDRVTAEDKDGDLLLYSLSGADASAFNIVSGIAGGAEGQITTAMKLDYETKSSYTVIATATDPSGATDSITVNISVNDVDDAPTISVVPGGAPEPTHACIVGGATTDEQGANLASDCQILLDAAPVLIGDGTATLNWSAETPITDWEGVSAGTGRVVAIRVKGAGLAGTIPAGLNGLDALTKLTLSDNSLTGEIPDLSDLDNLEWLILNSNMLSGSVPATLGDMDSLDKLWLYSNDLSGEIPSELGDSTSLRQIRLNDNMLTGAIPGEIGQNQRLRYLVLNRNMLSGEIPAGLGSARNMKQLYLHNNMLTGSIPPELGGMVDATGQTIRRLYLSNNDLSGDIPSELGALVSLTHLRLSGNMLTGCIPAAIFDAADDAAAAGLAACE